MGEESFAKSPYAYRAGRTDEIAFTAHLHDFHLFNVFSAAGLWIVTTVEPELSEEARRRFLHKQGRRNKYHGF